MRNQDFKVELTKCRHVVKNLPYFSYQANDRWPSEHLQMIENHKIPFRHLLFPV